MSSMHVTKLVCPKCLGPYTKILSTTENFTDAGVHTSTTVKHRCLDGTCGNFFERTEKVSPTA